VDTFTQGSRYRRVDTFTPSPKGRRAPTCNWMGDWTGSKAQQTSHSIVYNLFSSESVFKLLISVTDSCFHEVHTDFACCTLYLTCVYERYVYMGSSIFTLLANRLVASVASINCLNQYVQELDVHT
jgi:hypothetical protein